MALVRNFSCGEFRTILKSTNLLCGCFTSNDFLIQAKRSYAMKSSLPFKWVRPDKIPCIKPVRSGDLEPLKRLDTSKLRPLEFEHSEELKTAPEEVKKLFTLEYFPYKKTVEYFRHHYVDQVKRHSLDYSSPEARVARMTVDIRDLQNFMEKNPTDKRSKVRLKETIDKRKRLLKYIRIWDYKMFEWLLDELKIEYKPQPLRETYLRVERKRSLRNMTNSYCEDIVNSQLLSYKEKLDMHQESFLLEKVKTLEWIAKEESECGVEPTVTREDIENARIQLEQWRLNKLKPDKK